MARGPQQRVPFRRRRSGETDYRRRLRLLRGGLPRAVVRKSLNQVSVQIATYDETGDRIVASAVGSELRELGWSANTGNLPAAYLTGLLAAQRAARKGISKVVLDLGRQRPARGGRLFAAARGLVDGGLEIPHGDGVFPADERIRGAHLGDEVKKQFEQVREKLGASR